MLCLLVLTPGILSPHLELLKTFSYERPTVDLLQPPSQIFLNSSVVFFALKHSWPDENHAVPAGDKTRHT